MHMDMIFADHAFHYSHIFCIADLHDQVSAPLFDVALQHMVSVFGHPYDVRGQSSDAVAVVAVLLHSHTSSTRRDV